MTLSLILSLALNGGGGGTSAPAPEIWGTIGDSVGVSIYARTGGTDIVWPGTYNVRSRAPAGVSTTLPYDQAIAPTGTDYMSPTEYFAKQRAEEIGADVYVIPHNWNGTSLDNATGWGVGGTLQNAAIARFNAGIQAVQAVAPTAVWGGTIQYLGTNNANSGTTGLTTFMTNLQAAIPDITSKVFQNGVSGADISTKPWIIVGMMPEYISTANRVNYEIALRTTAAAITGGKYYKMPEAITSDNTHPTLVGNRTIGPLIADLLTDATAPTITGIAATGAYSQFESNKMAIELTADEYVFWSLSGAGASDFELAIVSDGASGINLSRMRTYLRWASDGTKAAGTYTVTLTAEDASGNTASTTFTVTVSAAYGTAVETVTPVNANLFSNTVTNDARNRANISVTLKRGMNVIVLNKNTGGATDISTVTFDGMVATRDAASGSGTWVYYLAVPSDRTGTLIVTPTSSSFTSMGCNIVAVTGTTATPASIQIMPNAQRAAAAHVTPSITCPTNGIILGAGSIPSFSTPQAGQTTLSSSGNLFTVYRTTTGAIGFTGGNLTFSWIAGVAFDKA